jgi:FtsZ-binding cell division protein ZapB
MMVSKTEYDAVQYQLLQSHKQLETIQNENTNLQQQLKYMKENPLSTLEKYAGGQTASVVARIEKQQIAKYQLELDQLKMELDRAQKRVQELETAPRRPSSPLQMTKVQQPSVSLNNVYGALQQMNEDLKKGMPETMEELQADLDAHFAKLETLLNLVAQTSINIGQENGKEDFNENPRVHLLQHHVEDLEYIHRSLSDENKKGAIKINELLTENATMQRQLYMLRAELREINGRSRYVINSFWAFL